MAIPAEQISLSRYHDTVGRIDTMPLRGRVSRVRGLLIESTGPRARFGDICEVVTTGGEPLPVQVVGFRDNTLLTVPLGELTGIRPGDQIVLRAGAVTVGAGPELLGRVVDALGRPLDGAPLHYSDRVPMFPPPLNPMMRESVNEPVADAVRAILDGHIVLSRDLASRHHYPPIDVLHSVSRTMPDVVDVSHRRQAGAVREWLAAIRDSDDLVNVGAYVEGANPRIDQARSRQGSIDRFLCQDADTLCRFSDTVEALLAL